MTMAKMKPQVVVGGLLSEAFGRYRSSFRRAVELYRVRAADRTQPTFPGINVFHPRTNTRLIWTLNILYVCAAVGLYIHMESRSKPYKLRWMLGAYNTLQVALASYVALQTLQYKLGHSGLLLCNPMSTDSEGFHVARVFALFYLQCYLQFFDTFFFLLRKSPRQVTSLHVVLHVGLTSVVGTILPFDYNGDAYFPILVNSLTQLAVYLHYLLAMLGTASWWGPYLTWLQLAQLCVLFGQSLLAYRVGPTCGSPDFAKLLVMALSGSVLTLFVYFFLQRYLLRRPYATAVANTLHGVVKAPSPTGGVAVRAQACGVARLDDDGDGVILLPPEFPDPQWAEAAAAGATRRPRMPPCPYAPFTVAYHLTPLGGPMPALHVALEVTRLGTRKGGGGSSSSGSGKGAGVGAGAGAEDGPSPRLRVNTEGLGGVPVVLAADTGAKAASLPPRGAGRPVLCFAVSGGAPGGRVSWLLTTTPKLPASDAADAVTSPPPPAAAAPRAAPRAAPATPSLKLEKPGKLHRRSASTGVLGLSPKDLKTLVTASATAAAAAVPSATANAQ